jgi:hypothetical protein
VCTSILTSLLSFLTNGKLKSIASFNMMAIESLNKSLEASHFGFGIVRALGLFHDVMSKQRSTKQVTTSLCTAFTVRQIYYVT